MTEYAIYKSRMIGGKRVYVELYRCENKLDTEERFIEYAKGKQFVEVEILEHESSLIMADTTIYTIAEELV